MKFVISVFSGDNKESAPIGFGLLENSGDDFEEAAKGDVTIKGFTHNASLTLNQQPLNSGNNDQHELYKED